MKSGKKHKKNIRKKLTQKEKSELFKKLLIKEKKEIENIKKANKEFEEGKRDYLILD